VGEAQRAPSGSAPAKNCRAAVSFRKITARAVAAVASAAAGRAPSGTRSVSK
jgi:hypothetical protein